MDTCLGTSSVPLVVAVPMECTFVAQFFPTSFAFWSDMVDFDFISIFEEQFAPTAFPWLFLK